MSEARKIQHSISVQEYLEGEQYSDVRHEYLDGAVYAMAGGTLNHNRITLNIAASLDDALDGTPCRTFASDVKVRVKSLESESYYYPDVIVTCDPSDTNDRFLEHPTTIFEVLSESTERIDRVEKFHAYRSLPGLKEYVLVSQERMEVTVARASNDWKAEILAGADAVIELPGIGQSLGLGLVYRNTGIEE